jgi:hypothetical protein
LALPIFVVTIFVSAFLLFLVQPIVGKLILPKLGGTPQVWNTCMVFFQSALLMGYAYTHSASTRLKLRQQLKVHCALLILPVLLMLAFPIYQYVQDWSFPAGSNPIISTLTLLGIVVGVPFFVVSTSAPLLQKWFAYSGHPSAKDPYFLYAASNLGSLLSLYFYPLAIEPTFVLQSQSWIWFGGYILLGACILYCALTMFKLAPPDDVIEAESAAEALKAQAAAAAAAPKEAVPAPSVESSTAVKAGPAPGTPSPGGARAIQRKKGMKLPGRADDHAPSTSHPAAPDISYGAEAPMTPWRRIRWVFLAAVPSSLMLGTTSYISTDLSPFPLIWIIPLSLYLLSFILVYLHFWTGKRIFSIGAGYTIHDAFNFVIAPFAILGLALIVLDRGGFDVIWTTFGLMIAFFAIALGCHGELAKDRPSTRYLTEYFLLMSVGGMVGGVFNGIIAPLVFQTGVLEFNIAILVACYVRPLYMQSGWFEEMLYSFFPGFQGWVRAQGDEMAKSMNRPAPHSTYLFSYFLDFLFAAILFVAVFWLSDALNMNSRDGRDNLVAVMKYLPVPKTQNGLRMAFRIVVFLIPMVFCFFFAGRPLRMGLALTALMVGYLTAATDERNIVEARRTYFGILRVSKDDESPRDEEEQRNFRTPLAVTKDGKPAVPSYEYTFLMHGTTYHGRNYIAPKKDDVTRVDLSRLATTYYHRYGPVGVVMERDNWFKGAQNTFRADVRMPATIVGQLAAGIGVTNLPASALVETWSEPPFATIGLGTGTMVSYAHPYQWMTYYEIDDVIREFSLPSDSADLRPNEQPGRFTYLQNAVKRGVNLEVIMGDARQSLAKGREEKNHDNSFVYSMGFDKSDKRIFMAPIHSPSPNREKFYKAINVDAFSSDAIPVHLVTKQAIELYLSKLTDDGVLMVHTSNRHMDLVIPVARIVMELSKESVKKADKDVEEFSDKELRAIWSRLNLGADDKYDAKKTKAAYVKSQEINCRVGKDGAEREGYMGHFSSEYVMVYYGDGFEKYLERLAKRKSELISDKRMRSDGGAPDGEQILNASIQWDNPFTDHIRTKGRQGFPKPVSERDSLWTDDYSYIPGVLRLPF